MREHTPRQGELYCLFDLMIAQVGCSSDLRGYLLENAQKLHGVGSSSEAAHGRRESSSSGADVCKMAMCVGLPPSRNFSASALEAGCTKGRGFVSRCNNGLVQALLHGLDCGISSELLRKDSQLYIRELALVVNALTPVVYTSGLVESQQQQEPIAA
jgi:hypothetical protein